MTFVSHGEAAMYVDLDHPLFKSQGCFYLFFVLFFAFFFFFFWQTSSLAKEALSSDCYIQNSCLFDEKRSFLYLVLPIVVLTGVRGDGQFVG